MFITTNTDSMRLKSILCVSLLIFSYLFSFAQTMNLSGQWQLKIDREGIGESEGWYKPEFEFDDNIELPASMPQQMKGDDISVNTKWVGSLYDSSYFYNPYMAKYRKPGKDMKLQFFLTPDKHYVGKAWYKRTVNVDKAQLYSCYELFLERPHITTKVWVNGVIVSESKAEKSLSVPHSYILRNCLKSGENTIVICVDNDPETVKVGQDSHSVSDQTQGCWNGIVGKIELRKKNIINSIKVYPDVDKKQARVRIEIDGVESKKRESAVLSLKAVAFNASKEHVVAASPKTIDLNNATSTVVEAVIEMGDDMLLWDEFAPQLYHLYVQLDGKSDIAGKAETVFGMRKMEIRDKMFYLNGREIQLRGTVENCDFPNTGYPPTDLDSWLKLFKTCKSYGLNHMRFHSYCPPEAAFLAADMTGFYIQPEGPSWPNHGVKLGRGEPIDKYLMDESVAIVDEYGNHPSFTFYAFGNEPAGNWVKWSTEHVAQMKDYDNRHLYCGFSVGGGWAWQPGSEFAVKAGARGLNEWTRRAPESVVNFAANINTYNGKDMPNTPITMPFVSHETGQWCAFPNFDEISKYTGVNKAKNFEIFRDLLKDNGMESMGRKFMLASGKLQALCYKAEIERTLRTPKYAGFQLLSLNDYSGQGTALVGVTDVFFDNKGYISNTDFKRFCSPIVPLAKIQKFTFKSSESFEAEVELSQYSSDVLKNASAEWTLYKASDIRYEDTNTEKQGGCYASGKFSMKDLPVGGNVELGKVSVPLNDIVEPTKLVFSVSVPGTEAVNSWNIWVYPEGELQIDKKKHAPKVKHGVRPGTWFEDGIYITDSLDAQAQEYLAKGKSVLVCAAGKVSYGKEVVQQFTPVFWNTSWFKMRPPHTTGIYVENTHPIFDLFPTDYYSDMQWWELVNKAQVMQFTDFPRNFQPLVQSIDTWFVSRKIGMLFEAKVGKGRLVMTTMDLKTNLGTRIVADQMKKSILNYMKSDHFAPEWDIEAKTIADLFVKEAGKVDMFTNDSPDELKPKLDNSLK